MSYPETSKSGLKNSNQISNLPHQRCIKPMQQRKLSRHGKILVSIDPTGKPDAQSPAPVLAESST
eukprot:5399153-Ditylum_brightwellii.AAC.1